MDTEKIDFQSPTFGPVVLEVDEYMRIKWYVLLSSTEQPNTLQTLQRELDRDFRQEIDNAMD